MRDNVEMTQPTLTTERLVLSAPTGDDIATIYELCQDPTIQKFVIPIGPNYTIDKAETFVNKVVPMIWDGKHGAEFAMRRKHDDGLGLIGMAGISLPSGELGLWLSEKHRGEGYGREAITAVMDWVTETAQTFELFAWSVLPENSASIRLAQKLGFGYTHSRNIQDQQGNTVTLLCGALGTGGEWPSSADLPTRSGERPETSKQGPHSQLTQNATPAIWGQLVAKAFSIPGVKQGHSRVSMADSMAGLLLDLPNEHGAWSLAADGPIEAFHIHGVKDTSIHAVLPSVRAKEVIEKGWGEPHTYVDFDTQIMIYAPRDVHEIEVIAGLLRESTDFGTSSVVI